MKRNPLENWRTVAQVARQCTVSSQAIRDAIKARKIEAWPLGEYTLIHKDQIPIFKKTRNVKWEQVSKTAKSCRELSHTTPRKKDPA